MTGEVMALNAKDRTATIKAGPIANWMDAMTMEYPIPSKDEFNRLHVGDKIKATVDVQDDAVYSLSHIEQQAGGTPGK
jgi:Cu/Ag efflux protein CusF